MPTTINASASSGLITTADTSTILQLQTGGTAAVTVDASQLVGIGTASPSRKLVVSNAGAAGFEFGAGVGAGSGNEVLNYNRSTSLYIPSFAYASTHTFYAGTAGGTRALDIDTAGNVGIGGAPSAWASSIHASRILQTGQAAFFGRTDGAGAYVSNNLYRDVSGNFKYIVTGEAQYNQLSGGSFLWLSAPSGTADTVATVTEKMRIDSSGNLLVGITSGNFHRLFKDSPSDFAVQSVNTSATTPYGHNVTFSAAAPNNATSMFLRCDDTGYTGRIQLRSNGGIANFSANNVNLSDRRAKTNFAPAKSYLDTICAIPVQTFNFIDQNMEEDGGLTLGVVAQDVQSVAPELVMESNWGTEEDPKMRLSIYQTDLQYALMKSIQELKALVDTQASTITSLTDRITALEGTTP